MSRELPSELSSEIAKPDLRPFLALHIDLPDPVRVFTGSGTMYFEGGEWIGAGGIGAIDTIGEATDGSATGIKAMLYEVPGEHRDELNRQAMKGALFEVWIGVWNETYTEVEAVKLVWKGRTDTYTITDSGNTISVEVTGESRMRDQGRPAIKRFTDEWQQRKYPGDRFFEFVPQMAEVSILWAQGDPAGTASTHPSSIGGGMFRRVFA